MGQSIQFHVALEDFQTQIRRQLKSYSLGFVPLVKVLAKGAKT